MILMAVFLVGFFVIFSISTHKDIVYSCMGSAQLKHSVWENQDNTKKKISYMYYSLLTVRLKYFDSFH